MEREQEVGWGRDVDLGGVSFGLPTSRQGPRVTRGLMEVTLVRKFNNI